MIFKNNRLFVTAILAGLCIISSCRSGGEASMQEIPIPDDVSYNLHIRPILSDNCFACHGPDANKREAGLRLDLAEEAYKSLKENPDAHAIVPGSPKSSEAFLRMITEDSSLMMPPPESNLQLTEREIRLIRKWIEQGAEFESHWAFTPPAKSKLPKMEDEGWPINELDYFILKQPEEHGCSPNPEAEKQMLLR